MKPVDMTPYLLPLYLIVVLLLQLELTVQNILLSCVPLIIVAAALYRRHTILGLVGIVLFYLVSLPLIVIPNMEDIVFVLLEMIGLVLPSIILVSIVLQLGNQEVVYRSPLKKPFILATVLLIIILGVFYLLTVILWEGALLSLESIEGQILLLAGLTVVCCAPFLAAES